MAKTPNAKEMAMRTLLCSAATILSVAATASTIIANTHALERVSVSVVNEREFFLSVELRDQLDPGKIREIEICVNGEGVGAHAATYGSGCSQVKRTEMNAVEPGSDITF
jgi:hypothetical protein